MNLEIIKRDGNYVLWRLNGYRGNSFIKDGKVFDAHVCEGPFDLTTDAMCIIEAKVQKWLDDQAVGYDQKVEAVRLKLIELGARVCVRHRQLAHREKAYLHIVADGGHYEWRKIIMPAIYCHFPVAYMTSGSFGYKINITVALER